MTVCHSTEINPQHLEMEEYLQIEGKWKDLTLNGLKGIWSMLLKDVNTSLDYLWFGVVFYFTHNISKNESNVQVDEGEYDEIEFEIENKLKQLEKDDSTLVLSPHH